jgi:hypothetical protein
MDGTTGNTVGFPATITTLPIGVVYKYADSGTSVSVQTSGIAKVTFNDTCTTGGLVSFATGTGLAVPFTLNTTSGAVLGVLVGPSVAATGTIAEVLINPHYASKE